jgi:pimeloyl-ACP methyl ester carboxylesterase
VSRGSTVGILAMAVLMAACTPADTDVEPEPEASPTPTSPAPEPAEVVTGPLADFYGQQLSWEPCDGDGEFECATVMVPLDYDDPEGVTIDLALLRTPVTSDDRIGSLLINPGGPGASGVSHAREPDAVSDDLRRRYDVVGFDPRGVGASAPIDCVDDDELDEFVAVDGAPSDEAELEQLREVYRSFVDGCEARSGQLLPHVGTVNVARDMDIIRATLGDPELYYLGRSYGSYLGAHYAEQFPERVGRLVLDGAVDPSLSGREFALGQARGIDTALTAYLAWCADQTDCPLGQTEHVARATLAALLDVIGDDPLPTDDPARPLTQPLAALGVILPLYVPPEQGYEVLTAALSEAQAGNGSVLLYLADIYLDRDEDGTYRSNQLEVFNAVHCLDRPDLTDPEEIEGVLAEFEEASPVFGRYLAWGGMICDEWPVESATEPAPVSAAGSAPILVVGTTGDLATPYEWAESVARQLESGVLLTYEGFGHLAYLRGSGCVDSTVDAYLLDGELPEEDAVCS